jgi:hypothetical protein
MTDTNAKLAERLSELQAQRKRWITDNWRKKYTHSATDMAALDNEIAEIESMLHDYVDNY